MANTCEILANKYNMIVNALQICGGAVDNYVASSTSNTDPPTASLVGNDGQFYNTAYNGKAYTTRGKHTCNSAMTGGISLQNIQGNDVNFTATPSATIFNNTPATSNFLGVSVGATRTTTAGGSSYSNGDPSNLSYAQSY